MVSKTVIAAAVALAFAGPGHAEDDTLLDNFGWTRFFVGTVDMYESNVEQRLIDKWVVTLPADFRYGDLAQFWESYLASREMAYSMFDRAGCVAIVPVATIALDEGLLQ